MTSYQFFFHAVPEERHPLRTPHFRSGIFLEKLPRYKKRDGRVFVPSHVSYLYQPGHGEGWDAKGTRERRRHKAPLLVFLRVCGWCSPLSLLRECVFCVRKKKKVVDCTLISFDKLQQRGKRG